jgi:hypothetical protein
VSSSWRGRVTSYFFNAQPFRDLTLARRLERTEGHGNAAFIDAQARLDPNSGAIWKAVGGTAAMFAGVGSPITQTFGLGIHDPLVEKDLDAIEHFSGRAARRCSTRCAAGRRVCVGDVGAPRIRAG